MGRAGPLMSFLLVILLSGTSVFAADEIKRNEKGERIWDLANHLKGTPTQIRETLWSDVVRLQKQVETTTAEVDADRKIVDPHKQAAIAEVRKTPAYRKAQDDVEATRQQLDQARTDRNSAEVVRLSSVYTKARESVTRIEKDAAKQSETDRAIRGAVTRLTNNESKLAMYKKSLAEAEKWRVETVDAYRNGYHIEYLPKVDDDGILGEITPLEFKPNGDLIAKCDIREAKPTGKVREGYVEVDYVLHPANITIKNSGLTPGKVTMGKPMRYDRGLKVLSVRVFAKDLAMSMVVELDDDMDALMKAFLE